MTGSDPESPGTFDVAVDGAAFRKAAGLFEGWIPKNQLRAHAGLWLDGGDLVVRIGKDEARVPATGSWPRTLITSAGFLIAESSGLPAAGEIRLSVSGDLLRLKTATGSRSGACRIHAPDWPEFIEQLTPFTMLETLLLPQRFSAASIAYSGLTDEIARCVAGVRDLVDHLDEAIDDVVTTLALDPAQAREALAFLVGPGLEELQRRRP